MQRFLRSWENKAPTPHQPLVATLPVATIKFSSLTSMPLKMEEIDNQIIVELKDESFEVKKQLVEVKSKVKLEIRGLILKIKELLCYPRVDASKISSILHIREFSGEDRSSPTPPPQPPYLSMLQEDSIDTALYPPPWPPPRPRSPLMLTFLLQVHVVSVDQVDAHLPFLALLLVDLEVVHAEKRHEYWGVTCPIQTSDFLMVMQLMGFGVSSLFNLWLVEQVPIHCPRIRLLWVFAWSSFQLKPMTTEPSCRH
ncbi:hypothetical protein Scep_029834 [Stephania cephalantha]|uniref:Uncharacterized protein n=1 Tax=Stephania cephalantha TaxID=152367 RepID=A0AAP0E683_9MAGN